MQLFSKPLLSTSNASNRFASAAGALGCALALTLSSGFFAKGAVAAHAKDSLSVARPFEVGSSLSGNFLAAIVANSERDTFAASTFFREALRDDPRNRDLAERALIAALANGNMPEAYGLAGNVLAHDRKNAVANLTRGVQEMQAHQYSNARAAFGKDVADRQTDIKSILLTAWTYAGAKDTRRALATFDKLHGEGFSVLRDYHAALIADIGGNKAEAERRFKAVLSSEHTVLRLVDAYARFLSSHGDNETARRLYKAFDEAVPNHPLVVAALADIDAGKPLNPFVRNAEEGAGEVLYGLVALGGGRQGDELAALIYLRLSLALAPNNTLTTFTLADIYERLKQEEAAIDLYDSVPEPDPLRVNADVQASLLLETLGKSKEAGEHLQAVVDAHPKDADALTALANLQRSRKLFTESAATYSRALALQQQPEKNQWLLYYYRGIANERGKNWPARRTRSQEGAGAQPGSALGAELPRLFLGRPGRQSRRGLPHVASGGRSEGPRRLYRGQSGLGLLSPRPLRRSGQRAGKGHRPQAVGPGDQRSPRRRLLACRPQAGGAIPVEPRARPRRRSGRHAPHSRQDQERAERSAGGRGR